MFVVIGPRAPAFMLGVGRNLARENKPPGLAHTHVRIFVMLVWVGKETRTKEEKFGPRKESWTGPSFHGCPTGVFHGCLCKVHD